MTIAKRLIKNLKMFSWWMFPEINWTDGEYPYNTFILKNDGAIMAAGINLGDQQKVTEINAKKPWQTIYCHGF